MRCGRILKWSQTVLEGLWSRFEIVHATSLNVSQYFNFQNRYMIPLKNEPRIHRNTRMNIWIYFIAINSVRNLLSKTCLITFLLQWIITIEKEHKERPSNRVGSMQNLSNFFTGLRMYISQNHATPQKSTYLSIKIVKIRYWLSPI